MKPIRVTNIVTGVEVLVNPTQIKYVREYQYGDRSNAACVIVLSDGEEIQTNFNFNQFENMWWDEF